MIIYIVGAAVIGILIGWIARNISIVRHARMETVLCIEGELYLVKQISKEIRKEG